MDRPGRTGRESRRQPGATGARRALRVWSGGESASQLRRTGGALQGTRPDPLAAPAEAPAPDLRPDRPPRAQGRAAGAPPGRGPLPPQQRPPAGAGSRRRAEDPDRPVDPRRRPAAREPGLDHALSQGLPRADHHQRAHARGHDQSLRAHGGQLHRGRGRGRPEALRPEAPRHPVDACSVRARARRLRGRHRRPHAEAPALRDLLRGPGPGGDEGPEPEDPARRTRHADGRGRREARGAQGARREGDLHGVSTRRGVRRHPRRDAPEGVSDARLGRFMPRRARGDGDGRPGRRREAWASRRHDRRGAQRLPHRRRSRSARRSDRPHGGGSRAHEDDVEGSRLRRSLSLGLEHQAETVHRFYDQLLGS